MNILNRVSAKKFLLFSVIIYLCQAFYRASEILIKGRFFAEEGAIYWSYSLANSIFNILFYDPVGDGYYCLTCNLQILLTKLLPLSYAPLATVWSSLFFAILPSFLFYKLAKKHYKKKIYLSMLWLLLFLPSLNFLEVFANSINTQSYLAISVLIILLFGNETKLLKTYYSIVILGFLSSYYSLAILPAFIIRYFYEKKRWLLNIISLGLVASFIQLNVFFYTFYKGSLYSGRLDQNFNLDYIISIISHSISINFATEKYYRLDLVSGTFLLIFLFSLSVLFFKKLYINNLRFIYILITYFFEIVLVYFGNPTQIYYGRYAVVSSTLMFFLYLELINHYKLFENTIFIVILVSIFNLQLQGGKYFIECNEYCISWPEQVKFVEKQTLDKYIHWPIGEGDPYWFTNADIPKPNPAPFQKINLGINYIKNYEISLIDILTSNLRFFLRI